jgi:large subunit ribosomal protein L3
MNAILGRKKEMTQIFDPSGKVIPITLIDTRGCMVVGAKNVDKDGYSALKLGFGAKKNASKPEVGKYKGIRVPAVVREVKSTEVVKAGEAVSADIFVVGDKVRVMGVSKGKGFAGVMKRWGFSGTGSRTHGQSTKPRHPGSIGAGTNPGRVLKGKKMAGRMGNDRVTIKGVEVVLVDKDNALIGLKGMVPGAKGSVLTITK